MLNNASVKYPSPDPLSALFMALGDPTRRAILRLLQHGDASVNDLARPFSMTLPAISRHLKVLERAGLISRGRQAQSRPSHLEADALKQGINWMNQYQELWTHSLPNLDAYLQSIQANQAISAEAKE